MQLLGKLTRFSFSGPRVYDNFVNGKFQPSKATKFYEMYNPVTQEHVARAPQSTQEEFDAIVANAK